MVGQLFRERECFPDQTRNALPQRVIEALDVIGFPGFLRDGAVLLRRNHPSIDVILVCMERRLFTIDHRNIGPELLATRATPISNMKRNDLAGGRIHGDPDPLFVRFLLHEAPHLIGFRFQARHHHRCRTCGELGMKVIGAGRKAFYHKVQEPRETDAYGTADPTE